MNDIRPFRIFIAGIAVSGLLAFLNLFAGIGWLQSPILIDGLGLSGIVGVFFVEWAGFALSWAVTFIVVMGLIYTVRWATKKA